MRPSFKSKSDITIGRIVYDMVVVCLGVFLALLLDQYWEQLNEEENNQAALNAIKSELEQNLEQVESKIEYHTTAREKSFEAVRLLEGGQDFINPSGWYTGLNVPLLRKASFTTALQIGTFNKMDPLLTAAVNDAYQCVDDLDRVLDTYMPALAQTRYNEGIRFFNIVGFAAADLANKETICVTRIRAAGQAITDTLSTF